MPRSPSLIRAEDSFASLLLQQGVSPASVQRQLGYGSIQLTVDTYGKWLRWAKKAAVDGLDSPSGSKVVANASQADAGDEKTQGNPRATRRSRTGDLLITKLPRRFSVEYCSGSLSAAEARCVTSFSPSLSRCAWRSSAQLG
jgi:hypothetical protein